MMHKLVAFAFVFAVSASAACAQDAATNRPAYWGTPSVDGGKCCQTLGEVRDNIDRIDRDLIKLMAEREKYVAEAGRFKPDPAPSAPLRGSRRLSPRSSRSRRKTASRPPSPNARSAR